MPLGAWTLEAFSKVGFQLRDIMVKTQHRDRSSEFYFASSGGYLLAHEYLYIFTRPLRKEAEAC